RNTPCYSALQCHTTRAASVWYHLCRTTAHCTALPKPCLNTNADNLAVLLVVHAVLVAYAPRLPALYVYPCCSRSGLLASYLAGGRLLTSTQQRCRGDSADTGVRR